jgi:hypothetical protein
MSGYYDRDAYNCIVNGQGTYDTAAFDLIQRGPVVLNWTDGRGTLYNILLALDPVRFGAPGGLVDTGPYKLWVGIAGRGCFGFGALGGFCSPEYASEKLGIDSMVDAELIAELVTGIRAALAEDRRSGWAAFAEGRA